MIKKKTIILYLIDYICKSKISVLILEYSLMYETTRYLNTRNTRNKCREINVAHLYEDCNQGYLFLKIHQ